MITSIGRYLGVSPDTVGIVCDDSLATIISPTYLSSQDANIAHLNNGSFMWADTDVLMIHYVPDDVGTFKRDPDTGQLSIVGGGGGGGGSGTVIPSTTNQVAIYPANGDLIVGLPTGNNCVMVTGANGAPAMSVALPNGINLQTPSAAVLTNATGLPVSGLTTVGTASPTTYLSGSGAWSVPSGSGGNGTVNPAFLNELALYRADGDAVSGLATNFDSVLVTNPLGVPSLQSTLPNGLDLGVPAAISLVNARTMPVDALVTTGVATPDTILYGDGRWDVPTITQESGLWTPDPLGLGASVQPTGTFLGSYIKVGNLVTVWFSMTFTSLGVGASRFQFHGLPFPSRNPGFALFYSGTIVLSLGMTNQFPMNTTMSEGAPDYFNLRNGATGDLVLASDFSDTTILIGSLQYEAA